MEKIYYKKSERRLLCQELELLAEESKHPDSSSDIARLAEAMCHIHDRLVRNRTRVLMLAIIVIIGIQLARSEKSDIEAAG